MAGPFNPVYVADSKVISIKGNQVEVIPVSACKTKALHTSDVKYVLQADNFISKLIDQRKFGKKSKLHLNPDDIAYLH